MRKHSHAIFFMRSFCSRERYAGLRFVTDAAIMAAGGDMPIPARRAALLATILLRCACAHAQEDVPFVTTPDNVTAAMLQAADVGPGDYVIDLGSGDGRIVIVAAKRFGARGLGVEIVPALVKESRENARRAGVEAMTEFREQDLFATDLSRATVVTLYLLPDVNLRLRPKILALNPGTRIVSHDWDMADWTPDRTVTVAVPDKRIGLEKSSRVHLWIVPARIQGAWCGGGTLRGTTLEIDRSFQQFRATLTHGASVQSFDGRIEGPLARSVDGDLTLSNAGDRLHADQAKAQFAPLRGATFTRRQRDTCK
jgi:SAM-dependent methyltransferase